MYTHIEDNIYTIPVPLPNNPLRSLNSYVIKGEDRNLLIDTGFRLEACRQALTEGLAELDVDMSVTDIFLTHMHADHTGLAVDLASESSRLYISREDGRRLIRGPRAGSAPPNTAASASRRRSCPTSTTARP